MTRSGLYEGVVAHVRFSPRSHRLSYRVFMLLVDLDEAPALCRKLKLFGFNAPGLVSCHDRDHAGRTDAPLRPQIEAKLAQAGIPLTDGRIELLAMPRVLGRGFSPLSVYYCYDAAGRLAATVHQVKNTFGEQHDYVLAAEEVRGIVRQSADKAFYVSPFMEEGLGYRFELRRPADTVSLVVRAYRKESMVLNAAFQGRRKELTDTALLGAVLRHPWQMLGVLAAIHLEAAKMLAKGFRYLGRPKARPQIATPALLPLKAMEREREAA